MGVNVRIDMLAVEATRFSACDVTSGNCLLDKINVLFM